MAMRPTSPPIGTSRRRILWRVALVLGAVILVAPPCALAQPQYLPYGWGPYYPYPTYPGPPRPPSWSYDPYTSGTGPCPQGMQGDSPPCRDRMPPSYGQPSYWAR
jgi:hypothetical protein